ncbi:MAG: hypothetical protein ACOC44_13865 [Promethearchaeia archaeon]
MPFKIPPFLIKKIFPPKEAVSTVDTNTDGIPDAILLKAINKFQPFTIPENINLGDLDVNEFDLSEWGEILLDGEPMDISKKNVNANFVRDNITIYHQGDAFTLDDLLSGKLGGRVLGLGDNLTIILKLDKEYIEQLKEGAHELTIELETIPTINVEFELTADHMNIPLDPEKL